VKTKEKGEKGEKKFEKDFPNSGQGHRLSRKRRGESKTREERKK